MVIPRNGRMSDREILHWFDEDIPQGLPEHVIARLIDGFWESEIAQRGLDDNVILGNRTEGWQVRLNTLDRRMWFASPLVVARSKASANEPPSEAMLRRLRPWQQEAWLTTWEEKVERGKQAQEKADHLLSTLVSPGQFEHYKRFGELMEPSKLHPGKVYILHKGVLAGNIDVYDDEPPQLAEEGADPWVPRAVICSSPVESYPDADLVAAQVLHLRADEAHFLQLANLHTGTWTAAEKEVRDAKPFVTVPRYDKRMGGWVNVPVNLETGECGYDEARKREKAERERRDQEDTVEQWGVWAEHVPAAVVDDFRACLGKYLTPDPATEELMFKVEGVQPDAYEPELVENVADVDIRLSFARRWVARAASDWLRALGLDEDNVGPAIEQVMWFDNTQRMMRSAPITNARPLFSLVRRELPSMADLPQADDPRDYVLINEPS